jgi:hypothetical protein
MKEAEEQVVKEETEVKELQSKIVKETTTKEEAVQFKVDIEKK